MIEIITPQPTFDPGLGLPISLKDLKELERLNRRFLAESDNSDSRLEREEEGR